MVYLAVWVGSLFVFRAALLPWIALHSDERYTYTFVVPAISAAVIWLRRHKIFDAAHYSPLVGSLLVISGVVSYSLSRALFLSIAAIVLTGIGGFWLCYGKRAVSVAAFPLGLLVLVPPIPARLLDIVVASLQAASAATVGVIFSLLHIPVLRNGSVFSLRGVDIEIAVQCSGIRSGMSLLIVAILTAYLSLRSSWARVLLVLSIVPIVIAKNAFRIVTLALLGTYFNPDFLFGRLHRYSGSIFSLLGIAIVALLVLLLKNIEGPPNQRPRLRLPLRNANPTF